MTVPMHDLPEPSVRLVRRWAGDRSDAETVGQSAFDLAERFVRAFFYIEELER